LMYLLMLKQEQFKMLFTKMFNEHILFLHSNPLI